MKKSKINEAIGVCYEFLRVNFPMARFDRINNLNVEFVEGSILEVDCFDKVIKIGDNRFHNVNFESDFMMDILKIIRVDTSREVSDIDIKLEGVMRGFDKILASNIIAFDENMNYFSNGVIANLFDILIDDDLLYNAYFSGNTEVIYNSIVGSVGFDYATFDALLEMLNSDSDASLADIQNTIGISLINSGSSMFEEVKAGMFTEVDFLPSHREKYLDCDKCFDIIDEHLKNRGLLNIEVDSVEASDLVEVDNVMEEMFINEVGSNIELENSISR